jgi:hypothetical protein
MSRKGGVSTGTPPRLRVFDPVRLADLENRAWVGNYRRRWPQVLMASVGTGPAKAAELEVAWWRAHREGR